VNSAIVIGAGPAGLTAAVALRRVGFEVEVLERRHEAIEVGSGLTLWPNALSALEDLDLADSVREVAVSADGIAVRSWRGGILSATRPERMSQRFGGGGVALSRASLTQVLADAAGADRIAFGQGFRALRHESNGVVAVLDDGSERHADVLIGADGVHSAVRSALFGELPLRYAGYVVCRGITRFRWDEPIGVLTMGRGRQFGLFSLPGGQVYWFASMNWPQSRLNEAGRLRTSDLLTLFAGWHQPIESVLSAAADDELNVAPIFDGHLRRRAAGRAAVIGDAAHPSSPSLGQGACQAIEDAVVLASRLAGRRAPEAALRTYEIDRTGRTDAMTTQARQMGAIGQWRNPLACWMRDRMIKHTPASAQMRHLDWLFSWSTQPGFENVNSR
jgi:2-polyprenyl-6-methoxyphenol hydroxylase-like FAD-dependent oxidoreductase